MFPLRVACSLRRGGEVGDGGRRSSHSRRRRPFGRRWPKRRRCILGKETAGLGGGGIFRSSVWQNRLGVRAEGFSGGGGGPRGSADPVDGGYPRGDRCLGVRVEEIDFPRQRGLQRRPLGR
uniref:Uncharacterized protein n=1 Tax=Oryza meridionalis TaxID=40149 RepID=A0A0E0EYS5_9ORYZ